MKIVCDNCSTKYSIADEKVRGKVFKIRCKKCQHIIVVRGGEGADAPANGSAADSSFPDDGTLASGGGGTGAGPSDAVWHLVIDREQVGPMSISEIQAKFASGQVDAETYAWREGFGDWLRLGSIDELKGAIGVGADVGTAKQDAADLFAASGGADDEPAASGDLFAGVSNSSGPSPSYDSGSRPASGGGGDMFGSSGGGGGGGSSDGLFGGGAPAVAERPRRQSSPSFAAASSNGGGGGGGMDAEPAASEPKMTGQRSENSVLFSLNNLQSLATGGSAPPKASERPGYASSQTEGSGLIDIRAMAASTLAASPSAGSGTDDMPSFASSPVFSPMAAPILMPAPVSGPPKWIWAVVGLGVLALLMMGGVGYVLLTRRPVVVEQVPAGTRAVQPGAAAVPGTAAPAATAAPAPAATGAPAAAPVAVASKDDSPGERRHAKSGGDHAAQPKAAKAARGGGADSAPAATRNDPAPAAAAPPPRAKKGGKDELDDLLNSASPTSSKPARRADPEESGGGGGGGADLPDQLDKGAIVGGMGKVKARVLACYDQFKVPGMANVTLTIGKNGRVSSASVGGAFSGTPTGDCVTKAVKGAGFPPFKGSPQTINYPYILR